METNYYSALLLGVLGFLIVLALIVLLRFISRKFLNRILNMQDPFENQLMKDERGRQLYIHQSHILMAGYGSSTECINCGGNSSNTKQLHKLVVECSMELCVYDGNR